VGRRGRARGNGRRPWPERLERWPEPRGSAARGTAMCGRGRSTVAVAPAASARERRGGGAAGERRGAVRAAPGVATVTGQGEEGRGAALMGSSQGREGRSGGADGGAGGEGAGEASSGETGGG
jgi:hypothetical protein